MTYSLKFHPDALEEWKELPESVREFFKNKLQQRLENPHIPTSRLSGGHNLYKIKRMRPPFRLTYHVNDSELIVTTLSVGKRDGDVYKEMLQRLRV
ncbi:MAG: type II toxin-antitoxin system RelE/ParE family toxin [Gammaproteobacteria bacterium]|nr:MAG: type II toxin-antitoxin system RelE/ParE family toxin [Gammaproteobacteria bacterium]